MPRPPLPIGAHGRIHRRPLPDGRWQALCRVRDPDGVTRRVYRYTPDGVKDRTGAAAERALLAALADRTPPGAAGIGPDTTLAQLWTAYRAQLEAEGRTATTLRSYDSVAKRIAAGVGSVRIREATAGRLDTFLRTVAADATPTTARKVRTLLAGMLGTAVRHGAIPANPVREVGEVPAPPRRRARSLDPDELAALVAALRDPDTDLGRWATRYDLADVVAVLAATGARIGEVLALRWVDLDLTAGTATVAGKIVRATGVGPIRQDTTKTAAGLRTVPLPAFAVTVLRARAQAPDPGALVFPGRAGGPRNPDTVWRQWRQARDRLGLDWVTPHTFRKTVATILDAEGLTARQAADHLGHAQVSMTQDVYFGRGRIHTAAAAAVDRALRPGP